MNPSAVFEAYINVDPFVKTIFPVSRVRFIENMFIKKQMLTDDYALIFFYRLEPFSAARASAGCGHDGYLFTDRKTIPICRQGPLTYEVPFPIIPPEFVLGR
jgi:hypothetical protein